MQKDPFIRQLKREALLFGWLKVATLALGALFIVLVISHLLT